MKIKVGMTFKAIEGLAKGKSFTVVKSDSDSVTYKSDESGEVYVADRKHFEKFIQRVNKHWADTNKAYKVKKRNLRNE